MDSWQQQEKNHKRGFLLKVVPVILTLKVLETCHCIPFFFFFFSSLWFCSKLKGQYTGTALTSITESGGAGFCVIWSSIFQMLWTDLPCIFFFHIWKCFSDFFLNSRLLYIHGTFFYIPSTYIVSCIALTARNFTSYLWSLKVFLSFVQFHKGQ